MIHQRVAELFLEQQANGGSGNSNPLRSRRDYAATEMEVVEMANALAGRVDEFFREVVNTVDAAQLSPTARRIINIAVCDEILDQVDDMKGGIRRSSRVADVGDPPDFKFQRRLLKLRDQTEFVDGENRVASNMANLFRNLRQFTRTWVDSTLIILVSLDTFREIARNHGKEVQHQGRWKARYGGWDFEVSVLLPESHLLIGRMRPGSNVDMYELNIAD